MYPPPTQAFCGWLETIGRQRACRVCTGGPWGTHIVKYSMLDVLSGLLGWYQRLVRTTLEPPPRIVVADRGSGTGGPVLGFRQAQASLKYTYANHVLSGCTATLTSTVVASVGTECFGEPT